MRKPNLSREMLKIIAYATMVLDHIGAVFLPWDGLRIIGRISFPIFCFLLAEGAEHTRNPGRYALRLLLIAALAELPYDILFHGGVSWQNQSVMLTLLIGLLTLRGMMKWKTWKLPIVCAGYLLAELLGSDYGGTGVLLICLFAFTEKLSQRGLLRTAGMVCLFLLMNSYSVSVFGLSIPVQLFGAAAMLPISCYTGLTGKRRGWVKWGFYLFYPAHLAILLAVRWILKM